MEEIAAQIPAGARLVDVGTDHGHLPIWLLLQGRITRAIATDVREGPLSRARENAARYGCALELRLGDGLAPVRPEECDTIAIAGMGGETIAAILTAAPWTAEGHHLLLLQPMTMAAELRQFLYANGYEILRETVCREEQHWYVVLTVRGGAAAQTLPLGACCLSPALLQAPGAPAYLAHLLKRARRALDGLHQARQADETRLATQELAVRTLQQAVQTLQGQAAAQPNHIEQEDPLL